MNEQRPEQVLVVEDDPDWLETFELLFLQKLGITILSATSLEEAQKIIDEGGITHVITDGLHGDWAGVAEAAKSADAHVVVVSGHPSVKKNAEESGIPFIKKNVISSDINRVKDLIE